MSSHNSFHGYVKLPGNPLYDAEIRFDFNPQIDSRLEISRVNGFAMRMFTLGEGKGEQPEIAVTMTAEQWLDLIAEMQREYESAQKLRKDMEDLQG